MLLVKKTENEGCRRGAGTLFLCLKATKKYGSMYIHMLTKAGYAGTVEFLLLKSNESSLNILPLGS
jgi:hypothetical protein